MLAGALFGGLSHSRGELMGARVLLGVGTAFARKYWFNPLGLANTG
jgi:hypothetical protein